jgi:hypothetical protein
MDAGLPERVAGTGQNDDFANRLQSIRRKTTKAAV